MYIIVAELREEMANGGNPHPASPKGRGEECGKIFENLVVQKSGGLVPGSWAVRADRGVAGECLKKEDRRESVLKKSL
jgi:hypothetical protein